MIVAVGVTAANFALDAVLIREMAAMTSTGWSYLSPMVVASSETVVMLHDALCAITFANAYLTGDSRCPTENPRFTREKPDS